MADHHQYCSGDFHPDDVVISGISGRFPECHNIGEFKDALLTCKNILIETGERHEKGAADLPFASPGTIADIDKFDAEYFNYSAKTAATMEVTQRLILEVSYEAIVDSGYDPTMELNGANIGVYTAISNDDGKQLTAVEGERHQTYATGYLRAMAANRCSYHFGFIGPSFTMDSACSSSLVALWSAYCDIADGRVDAALVNAGELCLSPMMTSYYMDGGIVSPDCQSSPFDAKANGIVRTEAVTALFLQKASVARRAYASILHVKHASGGRVVEGLAVPSFVEEHKLFCDVLKKSKIQPEEIQFVEAHGTGTQVGDPIEIKALEAAYCHNRTEPLLVGSVKSNVGHSEAAAGHTGAIKALIALESGLIPPNYNFTSPNVNCEALAKGTVKVISELTPLKSKYIPVNSFGFGGSIVQSMFKRNTIEYSKTQKPEELPRLVLFPGNTEAAIQHVFEYIKSHPELRSEFFALLNKLSFTPTKRKSFRGYALFQNENPIVQIKNAQQKKERETWFIMTGMGCQWPGMGLEMMHIKVFAESMKKSASVLKKLGIDLFELLKKDGKHLQTDRSITPAFVSIASIQIALVDVLRSLEIYPDHIIGHSTGELICAYADGCCTAEQTILSAYWRGVCIETANLAPGSMAAVGLTWEEATRRCPKDVYPACHNAEDSVTISGLKEPLEKFVAELQQENIFARVVNAYGYAFHSQHVWPAAKQLKKVLLDIIRDPKPRTERWISTSYPEEEWNNEACKMAGAEYFVHNLMSTVRFSDVLKKIPSDACTIEIGPHFLLQSILKRSVGSDACCIGLMKRNDDNNIGFFMESLGKLYLEGLNPKIENLYRPVQFPVPRGTPQICDLIQWNHSQSYYVPKWKYLTGAYSHKFHVDTTDRYLLDHFIDGRSLFPATGYVWLAWQALAKNMQCSSPEDLNFVVEDFKIHRPTFLSPAQITFQVSILESTGKFEITQSNSLVASGRIYEEDNIQFCEAHPIVNIDDKYSANRVSGVDIYDELRIAGYEYGPFFRRLVEASFDGKEGFVEWKDNWITFMDALLLFYMFSNENKSFVLPTGALSFKICPKILRSCAEESVKEGFPGVPVNFYKSTNICRTAGLEIRSLEVDSAPQHKKSDGCVFEEYRFVPYVHTYVPRKKDENLVKYMSACNTIIDKLQDNFKIDFTAGKFDLQHKIDFDVDNYINEASIEMKLLTALKSVAAIGQTTGILKEYEDVYHQHKIDFDVDNYINEASIKMKLLTTLRSVAAIDQTNDILKEYEDIYQRYVEDIGKDIFNNLLVNDYCLSFMFEVMLENTHKKMNVLEISNDFPLILPTVIDITEKFARMKFKNKSLACKDIEKVDQNKISECGINLYSYDSLSSAALEKSQNVVISAISANTNKEAREHIHLLSSLVEHTGFILLFHKDCILPPETLLASLGGKNINLIPQNVLEGWFEEEGLTIISRISHELCGELYLLRPRNVIVSGNIVHLTEDDPKWMEELKNSVVKENQKTWVVSEDCASSGIVGMINCLRHEPNGENIRCVFIPRRSKEKISPPHFSLTSSFFQDVFEKDLTMNIYKDGCWGSFRSVRVDTELERKVVDHSYVDIQRYGDLSSLTWMQSALSHMKYQDNQLIHIYYSALNFRDVMLATGKISVQTAAGMASSESVLGLECSGRNQYGERVCGICASRGMATAAVVDPLLFMPVPDHWSLEEAATVPVVYMTCYYGLLTRAGLKRGESILIHSGTGGVGQAAINIALSMDCEVYTTVGTERKRKYILEHFPGIKSENIGCSRDTSFENMIMKRTNGEGVHVVLNSLADDKFYASLRCVANHGRFVEIGKYDLALDHKIGLKIFLKNISFHGVFVDKIIADRKFASSSEVLELVIEGIRNGVVKPLDRTVFQRDEAEKAFRYMAAGTHIGKVLLKIRDEEKEKFRIPTTLRMPAIPVTYFYPHKVYIIIGGLGGFGIEVAKWLLQKGARNLVLTTRYGARTPYHHLCLKRWQEEGYNVIVSKRNASIKDEAAKLIKESSEIGPVGGIFNSAIVLNDAFLENTNFESFKEVCAPKADATRNLDTLSRCLCPELDHFVCFSSISCGRGNAGQMNYGYANSVMERVCEERRADGHPGLAIQWGIIGEVGVVHRHMGDDAMIAGVVAQRVKSCLNILDISCQLKQPVVCSYVAKDMSSKAGDLGDILQQLARIFGFKDPSEFNAVRSFGEMGVDSMIGIEVKHLLENTCEINLSMKEIQELKIDDVKAFIEKAESEKKKNLGTALVSTASVKLPKNFVHSQAVILLNEVKHGVPVFILDIDCENLSNLKNLAAMIKLPVYGLVWSKEVTGTNVESLSSWYLEEIKKIAQKEAHLVAHSSSCIIAVDMIFQNQKSNSLSLSLTVMNGYNYLLKLLNKDTKSSVVDILCDYVENYIPSARIRLKEQISGMTSFEQQIRAVIDFFTKCSPQAINKTELSEIITASVKKLELLEKYAPTEKLSSDLVVIEDSTKLLANDIAEAKMLLSEITTGKITIQRIPDISDINEESLPRIASTLKTLFDSNLV